MPALIPLLRSVRIKGQFFAKAQDLAASFPVGAQIALVPEPENSHDAFAVRAENDKGVKIGYLQKEVSPIISLSMRNDTEVVCHVVSIDDDKKRNMVVDIFMVAPEG